MRCQIVPVEGWHVAHVAAHVREADAAEIWASHHLHALEAIEDGLRTSVLARTGLVDGEPVCVFGVCPSSLLTGAGSPWMLATPLLHTVDRAFIRLSRRVVDAMQSFFAELSNYVDARNLHAVRWLEWLGFHVEPAVPYGIEQLPFHRFTRSV